MARSDGALRERQARHPVRHGADRAHRGLRRNRVQWLDKQSFWDLIHLRHGWRLNRLPELCECGLRFTTEHALSCKKGGFVTLRHNSIRNITATLLKETCTDVKIEPQLQPLTGENFNERTANITNQARLDICARGFWTEGQMAFFCCKGF